jgi:nucleoside-diphosphate-sugar epimerase
MKHHSCRTSQHRLRKWPIILLKILVAALLLYFLYARGSLNFATIAAIEMTSTTILYLVAMLALVFAALREIAETIVSVFQRGKVTYVEWPDERRRIEIGHVKLSSAKLRDLTNWEPRHDFMSGLQKTKAVLENQSL